MAAGAVALIVHALQPWLPGAHDYIDRLHITPSWVPWTGPLMGVLIGGLMASRQSTKIVVGSAWLAAFLLLWSGAGLMFDVFRAFFWLTAIPAGDFAQVDLPGGLSRLTATGALAVLIVATVGYWGLSQRERSQRTNQRFAPWFFGYAAAGLALVYPLIKFYWFFGGRFGRPSPYVEGAPLAEAIVLVGGVALALALVRPWLVLPRRLLLAAGWGAAGMLLLQGSLPLFALVNYLLGGPVPPHGTDSANTIIIGVVYGSWMLMGVALGLATVSYQRRSTQR